MWIKFSCFPAQNTPGPFHHRINSEVSWCHSFLAAGPLWPCFPCSFGSCCFSPAGLPFGLQVQFTPSLRLVPSLARSGLSFSHSSSLFKSLSSHSNPYLVFFLFKKICLFGLQDLLLQRAGSLVMAGGLVALQRVGPHSPNRDPTYVPCIGRQILNCWTTREVLGFLS